MESAPRPRKFANTVLVWASIVIIVAGMRASASLVVPFLLALFLAILCGPPLEWLSRHGLRRSLAMLLVMGGLCFVVLILAQVLATTAGNFIEQWPRTYQPRAEEIASDWRQWIEKKTDALMEKIDRPDETDTTSNEANEQTIPTDSLPPASSPSDQPPHSPPGDVAPQETPSSANVVVSADDEEFPTTADPTARTDTDNPLADSTRGRWNDWIEPDFLMRSFTVGMRAVSGILSQALLILITTIFLLMEAATLPAKLHAISDDAPARLEKLQRVVSEVNQYMAIKTSTSLLTGGVVALSLWLLDVDFALLWGMTAFVLNFVPNIGSIIAAVPAVLLTVLQQNVATAAVVVGIYVMVNMFVGYYLEPKWMGRGLGLSTLVVFVSLVFWGWVLGPVGMVISVPLTMAVKIALEGSEDTRWLAILMGPGGVETVTS